MWRGKLRCLESKSSLLASRSPFFSFMTKLWNGSVVASWVGTANGFILLPFHHLKSFQAYRENASIFHPFKRQQSWRDGKEYNKNNIPESVHGMRQHKLYRINRWQSTQAAQQHLATLTMPTHFYTPQNSLVVVGRMAEQECQSHTKLNKWND